MRTLTERQLKILIAETLLREVGANPRLGSGAADDLRAAGRRESNNQSSDNSFKHDCDGDGTDETHVWSGRDGWNQEIHANTRKLLNHLACIVKTSDARQGDGDNSLPAINSLHRTEARQVWAMYSSVYIDPDTSSPRESHFETVYGPAALTAMKPVFEKFETGNPPDDPSTPGFGATSSSEARALFCTELIRVLTSAGLRNTHVRTDHYYGKAIDFAVSDEGGGGKYSWSQLSTWVREASSQSGVGVSIQPDERDHLHVSVR